MTSNDENETPFSPSDEVGTSTDPQPSLSAPPPVSTDLDPVPASQRIRTWFDHFKVNSLDSLKNIQFLALMEWASKTLQKRGASFFGKLLTVLLCTFFLADIAAILAGRFIPEPPYVRPVSSISFRKSKTIDDYNIIFTRNLFSSKGLIPGEEATPGQVQDLGGPPIKTSLPFNLVGTLILEDSSRSIATIEDKSASAVYPVRVDDEIPTKAKIIQIDPRKVIFVNIGTGRREFVELPEDLDAKNPRITLGSRKGNISSSRTGIEQTTPNSFNIARSEIDKAMSDFNNILTQARAVPNFENGVPNGYKLFQIVPGSIYQKLGFQNGDIITQLNGESANDPAKALAALQSLKDQKHYEISGKRDGRPFTYSYDFQ